MGVIQAAQPDPLGSEPGHHGLGRGPLQGEAHQAGRRGRLQQGLGPGHRLELLPELVAEGRDGGVALLGAAFGFEQGEGAVEPGEQGDAGGGYLKAAAVGVEATAGLVFMAEAAPADQGGLGLHQHPLRQGHGPQTLGPTAPLVPRAAVDIGGCSRFCHRDAAQGLGRIHQQVGVVGVAGQLACHGGDGHQLARVPQQVGEHHQTGFGG